MKPEDASRRRGPGARPFVPPTPFSLLVTFSYDRTEAKGGVRLARVERVRAISPGIATAPPQPGQSGAWVEVRDGKRNLLYYRPLHDPIPTSTEVFSDESGQPSLSRIPSMTMQGEFTVLVPDLPNAVSFAFHASPVADLPSRSQEDSAGTKRRRKQATRVPPEPQPAQELAHIAFTELRHRATELR